MENQTSNNQISASDKAKKWLILTAFVLFSILLVGIFYLFTTAGQTANIAFAYVVGLSMIVLPCTLPLAFVIVPMAMGKTPKKGFLMSVFFGLGLALMLSIYGAFVAFIGKSIGLDQAIGGAGAVSKILFIIGGLAAFIFGLSELNLIKFKMFSFGGAIPQSIQNQSDYLKAFFLGLFLGNAGVGCPNPLFYVLLGDIAVVGSVTHGWWLGFVHGVGRATPLIFLSILGILGVNAVSNIAKKAVVIKKWTGIALILLGAFIFIMGTSHQWYESTGIHSGWNNIVQTVAGDKIMEKGDSPEKNVSNNKTEKTGNSANGENREHEDKGDFIPAPWSWIVLLFMIIIPLGLYKFKIAGIGESKKIKNNKDG